MHVKCPVADPGFPRGGGANTILPKFPKNCMKLKEFGPPGRTPFRSVTGVGGIFCGTNAGKGAEAFTKGMTSKS